MSDSSGDLGAFVFGAAGHPDPYPRYAELREAAAVHDTGGMRYVTRYDDVVAAVRDHERFSSDVMGGMAGSDTRMIISTDPPEHTKLRRLVTRPFHPAAIAELEPRIRELATSLVDDLIVANREGDADLIDHLGAPLPVVVIAEMLGIPASRREEFRTWSDNAIGGMGATAGGGAGGGGALTMGSYFGEIIAERRESPGDDLISLLIGGAEPLTEAELVLFCMTLLVAGNETTTNLVGNAGTALFDHPEQAERLWADPSLIPCAVEEVLRYDPPAQSVVRRATEDLTIGDVEVPAGTVTLLGLASANRDPRHFDAPDCFDVGRNPRDHLTFGSGVHLCLGAPLARLEARIVLEELVGRVRDLRPSSAPSRRTNLLLRGFHKLPITFDEVG